MESFTCIYFSQINTIIILLIFWFINFFIKDISFSITFQNKNSSITIYTILGFNQTFNPDIRGHFWEPQIEKLPPEYRNVKIYTSYIAEDEMNIPGIRVLTPYNMRPPISDRGLYIRTTNNWIHFLRNYPDVHWLYRGVHDSYINLTNLIHLINLLEYKYDPMKEIVLRYGLFQYADFLYPHGGSGHLLSNAAVKYFYPYINHFREMRNYSIGDDTALTLLFEELNINLFEFQSEQFIPSFPETLINFEKILEQKRKNSSIIPPCPEYYYPIPDNNNYTLKPSRFSEAAVIHAHHVPMQAVEKILSNLPESMAFQVVTREITFCEMKY